VKPVRLVTLMAAVSVFSVFMGLNVPDANAEVSAGPDQEINVEPALVASGMASRTAQLHGYYSNPCPNRPIVGPDCGYHGASVLWTQTEGPPVTFYPKILYPTFEFPLPEKGDIKLKFKLDVWRDVTYYNTGARVMLKDSDDVSILIKRGSPTQVEKTGVTIDKESIASTPPLPEDKTIAPPDAVVPLGEPVLPPVTTEEQVPPQVADEVPLAEPPLPPVTAADEVTVPTEPSVNQPPPEEVPPASEPLLPPASDELSPSVSKEPIIPPEESKLQPSEEIQKAPIEPPVTEQEQLLPMEPQLQPLIEGEVINPQVNNTNTTISSEPTLDKIGSSDKIDIPDLEKKK